MLCLRSEAEVTRSWTPDKMSQWAQSRRNNSRRFCKIANASTSHPPINQLSIMARTFSVLHIASNDSRIWLPRWPLFFGFWGLWLSAWVNCILSLALSHGLVNDTSPHCREISTARICQVSGKSRVSFVSALEMLPDTAIAHVHYFFFVFRVCYKINLRSLSIILPTTVKLPEFCFIVTY